MLLPMLVYLVLSTCTSMKAVSTAVALTTIVPTAVSRIEDYELDEDMCAFLPITVN